MLPESPRWLLSKNRQNEALEILNNVARTNKKELSLFKWNCFLENQQTVYYYAIE